MHQRKLQPRAPPFSLGRREVLTDAAYSGLTLSAARVLNQMVSQAKRYFESGLSPDEVFRDFDVERLKNYLTLDKKVTGELLSLYKDRKGDEKFSASVLVATAIFFTSVSEPALARDIVADIVRRARKDERFAYIAKVTLISIAELSRNISEEAGLPDEEFTSLGKRCMDLFSRL